MSVIELLTHLPVLVTGTYLYVTDMPLFLLTSVVEILTIAYVIDMRLFLLTYLW